MMRSCLWALLVRPLLLVLLVLAPIASAFPGIACGQLPNGGAFVALDEMGVVHAWGDRLEIRGPKIDDLLPNVQQRPPAAPCEADALDAPEPCERITLPLRAPKPRSKAS